MSSSVQKGDSLEAKVKEVVRNLVSQGKLGLNSNNCQVHSKKKYFSKERNDYIVTDVSIELFVEGADAYSILWVWECKDYNSPVPVDDVEEFHAKLQQIGPDNTKGIIITRGNFQRGAINYAQSNKIGLCRLLPDEQVDWVWYLMTSTNMQNQLTPHELLSALSISHFRGKNRQFYGLTSESRGVLSLEEYIEIELQRFVNS